MLTNYVLISLSKQTNQPLEYTSLFSTQEVVRIVQKSMIALRRIPS